MNYEFKPASMCEGVNAVAAMMTASAQSYEPMVKAAARANLEVMSLTSRRAQALMDLPNRLVGCRTPVEVMSVNMNFWQTAAKQYADAYSKMWGACMGAIPVQPWNMSRPNMGQTPARDAAASASRESRDERPPVTRPRPARPDRDAA
jgi:hypothetical protein